MLSTKEIGVPQMKKLTHQLFHYTSQGVFGFKTITNKLVKRNMPKKSPNFFLQLNGVFTTRCCSNLDDPISRKLLIQRNPLTRYQMIYCPQWPDASRPEYKHYEQRNDNQMIIEIITRCEVQQWTFTN